MVRAVPPDMVLHLVEDPEFRYEDFAPRGEQAPPTMRAQVWRNVFKFTLMLFLMVNSLTVASHCLQAQTPVVEPSFAVALLMLLPDVCRTIPGRTMASLWSTDYCQIWASSWMKNSRCRRALTNII